MARKSGGTTVAGSKRGSSRARKTLPVAAKADLETPAGAETAVHIMGLTDAIQLDRPTRFGLAKARRSSCSRESIASSPERRAGSSYVPRIKGAATSSPPKGHGTSSGCFRRSHSTFQVRGMRGTS